MGAIRRAPRFAFCYGYIRGLLDARRLAEEAKAESRPSPGGVDQVTALCRRHRYSDRVQTERTEEGTQYHVRALSNCPTVAEMIA